MKRWRWSEYVGDGENGRRREGARENGDGEDGRGGEGVRANKGSKYGNQSRGGDGA